MINLDTMEHNVRDVRTINRDLFELVVDRNGLTFTPGDCVALYTEDEKSRPYSIASGPQEETLRFIIRCMESGEVSPWLKTRTNADTIRITPPFGWFRPGQEIGNAPYIVIATGTGIAPFLSCMHAKLRPPAACLYGVREAADAIGFEALEQWCPTHLAVSREKTKHHHGRITDLLHQLPLNREIHYYCCGLESMINEVGEWLQANGIQLPQIHREVFFHG